MSRSTVRCDVLTRYWDSQRDEVLRRFSEPIDLDADISGKGKGKSGTGGTNPRVLLISLKAYVLSQSLFAS